MKGKIIVFEGIDGSGKGTQSKKLYQELKELGKKVELIEFPNYDETFFGKEVGNYLNGDFGGLNEVDPKLSAILYAGDRFEKKELILEKVSSGYIVICDRYVPSNIAHQTAKFKTKKEQKKLKNWIEELEYEVFGLPKADLIFFMDMNPDISDNLVLKKDARSYTSEKKDLHEKDNSYLKDVYQTFSSICTENDWIRIYCQNSTGSLKSISEISGEIMIKLKENKVC